MHGKVRVYHDMIIESPKFVPKLLLSRYAVVVFGFHENWKLFLGAFYIFSFTLLYVDPAKGCGIHDADGTVPNSV